MQDELGKLAALLEIAKLAEYRAQSNVTSSELKVAATQSEIEHLRRDQNVDEGSLDFSEAAVSASWIGAREKLLLPLQAQQALNYADLHSAKREAGYQTAAVRVIEEKLKEAQLQIVRRQAAKRHENLVQQKISLR